MTPIEVNDSNQLKIGKKYYCQGVNRKPFKFAIRDHLRISRDKGVLAKGYVQRWSEEHFVIESRLRKTPNVYALRDLSGDTLQGVFYEYQFQRVKAPDVFPIFVLYENRVKEHLWSADIGLKIQQLDRFKCICLATLIFYMKIKHRDM